MKDFKKASLCLKFDWNIGEHKLKELKKDFVNTVTVFEGRNIINQRIGREIILKKQNEIIKYLEYIEPLVTEHTIQGPAVLVLTVLLNFNFSSIHYLMKL